MTGSMERDVLTVLPHREIDALAHGLHENVFSALGPHQISDESWEVRVLRPAAIAVDVVGADGVVHATQRVGATDLFVARIAARERPAYRLRIVDDNGERVISDPYAFEPPIDDAQARSLAAGAEPYRVFGAHPRWFGEISGVQFVLWAPNARRASVVGDFNDWDGRVHCMRRRHEGGVFDIFIPDIGEGARYKFELVHRDGGLLPLKADPFAFAAEHPPATASIVCAPPSPARPSAWRSARAALNARDAPISIYECHLGSWARVPHEGGRYLTYAELAERLVPYVRDLGFTHLEIMPIAEYPFDGSWGYQPVSLFAPTSRFGTPADFIRFVEAVHAAGLVLLIDWVPAHFPNDAHGLAEFDGTHLFEHADPRQGFHHDWGTHIFNYDRAEVANFLVANAQFWLERYDIDGLRVDAVASMLYLDYSRRPNEWVPNRFGGRENIGAIEFIQRMNERAYATSPGVVTIAEESTAWPGVSKPTYLGGLGFGYKWNMGWMHDTLNYMQLDPIHRRHHHHDMTFAMHYAYTENFVLPLSHDEVVHGKGSLISKMPGDRWRRFANLRAYFGYMWGHPGKKLLFMGGEFAQEREWNHDHSLDWHLVEDPDHRGVQSLVRDLNAVYRAVAALHDRDCDPAGFRWLIGDDSDNSVFAFARHGRDGSLVLVVSNFTPVPRYAYRIGVERAGFYEERVNTDSMNYGGSDVGNFGGVRAAEAPSHGFPCAIELTLPPLATLILVHQP